ncbi:MAG: transglycosylase domain-containing protein [Pseudooceanicola nanhaiensis]|uniref:transglycosylase domain-containing protein n=1 Tax=Pseudooceanicola nanhaiensis TaxID=375761 RepID=UPI0040590B81
MKDWKSAGTRLKSALSASARGIGRFPARRAAAWAGVTVIALGAGATALWVLTRPTLDDVIASAEARPRYQDSAGAPLLMARGVTSSGTSLKEMAPLLPQAVIALEDRRFRDHGGVDLRSIARALAVNTVSGGIVEGGSTITQQLIKTSYLSPEKSYARKLHEALLARQMEARYSKDEILERYLNTVYLGNGVHGVADAAQLYFGKSAAELSLAESAILAAIIRAPSEINPFNNSDALRDRATLVVTLMQQQGLVEADAADDARIALATMRFHRRSPAYGGWFADWVQPETAEIAGRIDGAVTVRTTLDPALQARAEASVNAVLEGSTMEAALVALRPDGSVAAMVGGRDYATSQFNRATDAVRQPGSTFKTIVYLAALEAGYGPDTLLPDRPLDIDGYAPENFGGRFHGDVTMREAFADSYNAAAVQLAMDIGIDRVAEAARALGIEAELSETPALSLGASGMSLMDITEAYAAIATGRAPVEAHGVEGLALSSATIRPLDRRLPEPSGLAARLLSHRGEMTEMLRAVVTEGTGEAVGAVPGAVGKTGTSQSFRDALFVGWDEDLIVGVWVGNDDNSPMDEVTGGSLPAEIWARFQAGEAPASEEILVEDTPRAEEPVETVIVSAGLPGSTAVEREEAGGAKFQTVTSRPGTDPRPDRDAVRQLLNSAVEQKLTVGELSRVLRSKARGEESASNTCNVQACSRFYRSFRASDCTFQPYGNRPREVCTR